MATPGLSMTSPLSLAGMNVDTGLLQKVWRNNQLYMESLQNDPLFSSETLTRPIQVGPGKNVIVMPKEIFIDCTPPTAKGKGARSVELIFLAAIDDDPIQGNASSVLGNEATLELKFTTNYANDWGVGVTEDTYGIDFRELNVYGVYDQIRPLLAQWLGELRGYYARYALMHGHSPNLEAAPISLSSGTLNRNFFCLGLDVAFQPEYSTTAETFANNIGTAMAAADANTNVFTVPNLLTYIDWLRDTKYLAPAMVGTTPMYLQMAGSQQFRILRDPSVDNSWGRYYRDVAATEDLAKVVPGAAKIMIAEEMVVVRDSRAPTITLAGGGSSAYTLTSGFMKMGRTDTRITKVGTSGSSNYFDANITLGAGALVRYEPEAPHYEDQPDAYKKYKGNGLFGAVGYQTPVWDIDSAPTSGGQQESSCVLVTPRL